MNILFSKVAPLVLATLLLNSCGGGSSGAGTPTQQGTLNLAPQNFNVELGNSVAVPFQLVGSQGVVNQFVSFSVSDPTTAQVSPDHCVVSSGINAGCVVTLIGLKRGAISLTASSQGYSDYSTAMKVITGTGVGTISIDQLIGTTFYVGSKSSYWSVTVKFTPSNPAITQPSKTNPITVYFQDPTGSITKSAPQCGVWADSPTCTLSGTWNPSQTPGKPIIANVGITGAWQAGDQPFNGFAPIPVPFTPTTTQTPGTIQVASQNSSGQIYAGMNAPLFVQLNNTTYNQGNYDVTLSIPSASQKLVSFYEYKPGSTLATTSYTKTCNINFDTAQSPPISNYGCGFGLTGKPNQQGAATIDVTVTPNSQTPPVSADNPAPTYENVFNFSVDIPGTGKLTLPNRTITITNNSSNAIVFAANNGTSSAYNSSGALQPKSVACGYSTYTNSLDPYSPNPINPSPAQACPIGSTCLQGGANPTAGTQNKQDPSKSVPATIFQCFWDQPVVPTSYLGAKGQPNSTATITLPAYSGVTTGAQQIQWSGSFYALNCSDPKGVSCPARITGQGTGPTNPAQTIAEVTFQRDKDYYDVSIINGVSNSIQFGPDPASGKTSASGNTPYWCGTAGSSVQQSGSKGSTPSYLYASPWTFAPTASGTSSSFPNGLIPPESASSYYALVVPSTTTIPTPPTCQSSTDCVSSINGPVCGINLNNILKSPTTVTFGTGSKVCGAFQNWATADQIWGWNITSSNQAPFAFATTFPVPSGTVSVAELQLCPKGVTYSSYQSQSPPLTGSIVNAACGGTNWTNIATPSTNVVTVNPNWNNYVLPTISWLKVACPTCYTYPFDDQSSTFQCTAGDKQASGTNTLNYNITFGDIQNVF